MGWVGMEAPLGSVHKEFVDDKLISRQLKFDCMHQQDCLARGKKLDLHTPTPTPNVQVQHISFCFEKNLSKSSPNLLL